MMVVMIVLIMILDDNDHLDHDNHDDNDNANGNDDHDIHKSSHNKNKNNRNEWKMQLKQLVTCYWQYRSLKGFYLPELRLTVPTLSALACSGHLAQGAVCFTLQISAVQLTRNVVCIDDVISYVELCGCYYSQYVEIIFSIHGCMHLCIMIIDNFFFMWVYVYVYNTTFSKGLSIFHILCNW